MVREFSTETSGEILGDENHKNHENHKKSLILSSTSPFEAESQFLQVVTVKAILKTILKERKNIKRIKEKRKEKNHKNCKYLDCDSRSLTTTLTTLPVVLLPVVRDSVAS